MVSLARTKTVEHEFLGVSVTAEVAVPSAVEWVEALNGKSDNIELVRRFVKTVLSDDVEGMESGVTGEELVNLPQTFSLVMALGADVIAAAMPTEAQKNA